MLAESNLDSKKVKIIGAGFSGLTLAYYLLKQGYQVEIFEKQNRIGGLIGSIKTEGMIVETAANGFLWTQELAELCADISCELQGTKPAAKRRYIFWNKITRWPLGIFESLKLIGFAIRLMFFKSSVAPFPNESISNWGERVLGSFFVQKLLAPALQGIYAGDPEKMSATLILKILFKTKSEKAIQSNQRNDSNQSKPKRGTHSPPEGMQEFTDKLAAYLRANSVRIHLQSDIGLEEARKDFGGAIVVASNPKQMLGFLSSAYPELEDCFAKIEMLSLARVTVGIHKPQKSLNGFGVLFAKNQNFRVLGVLSNSETFENRGALHNESWIFGGAKDQSFVSLSDEKIQKQIEDEREKLLGARESLQEIKIVRWSEALIHYDLNLEQALENFDQGLRVKLQQDRIWLTGNYLGSIGLSRILSFNRDLAEQMGKSNEQTS